MGEEDPFKRLAELQERTRELARDLQNVTDMTLNAIGQYLGQEGTSDEDDLSAFQQWVADNLEEQLVAAVEETVQAYLDATETSLDEATVGGYVEWAEGATTSEEEAEGGEPTEAELQDGEGGGDVPAEAVEQVATVLEDVVDMVADATQTLQEEVGAVGEQTETAVEEVSELKARLADLEESADSRALTEGLGQQSEDGNEYDEDETPPPEEGGPQVDTSQPGVIGQG